MTPTAAQTVRELCTTATNFINGAVSHYELRDKIAAAEALLAREGKDHSSFSPACASADRYAFRRHVKKILSNLDMNTHD